VNELSIIFDKLNIDTKAVLEAANTKWNFLDFKPGLVGGHCIGVDPYYLTFKAQEKGHSPQTILSGRRINDGMGRWIANKFVKMLIDTDKKVKNCRVVIFGLTFKENVTDVRNSKVADIIKELQDFGVHVYGYDPNVNQEIASKVFGISLVEKKDLNHFDGIIFAVAHDVFADFKMKEFTKMVTDLPAPFIDVKWQFNQNEVESAGFNYWSL